MWQFIWDGYKLSKSALMAFYPSNSRIHVYIHVYVLMHLSYSTPVVEYVNIDTQSWTYNQQISMKFHSVFGI